MQQGVADLDRLRGMRRQWNEVMLGDHVSYVKTVALSRSQLDSESAVRYLHYGDIHTRTSARLDASSESMPRVSSTLIRSAGMLEIGDLVFADASEDTSGVGKSVEITSVPRAGVVAGLHTIVARFDKSVLADGFKAYLQFVPSFRRALLRLATGTKVLATTRASISSITLALPPLDDQDRIVGTLIDVDDLISALERKIAKKQAIKQAMMQQLLTGKTRLPGFTGDWSESNIGEVASVVGGGTPSTQIPALWGGEIPWLTPAEVPESGAGVLTRSDRTITEIGLQKSAAKLLPEGTVLVTSRASIGNCAIAGRPLATNQGFTSLVPKDRRSRDFLYYWVQQHRASFVSRATGSTFLEISGRKVAGIQISVPDLNEQAAVGSALSDADHEIDLLKRQLNKYRLVKAGMMQELLTGHTRLVPQEVSQ